MNDRELEQLARGLGEDAARRVNTDRVVERVLARLREEHEPVAHSLPMGARWLQIAAVIVLLVIGGVVTRTVLKTPEAAEHVPLPLAWEELNVDEWNEVLDSLTYHAPIDDYVGTTTLYDLTEEQLRELLMQMES